MDSVLKTSILIVQKLALHQNGVQFCQQFDGAIKTSVSVQHCARLKTFIFFFFNPSPSSYRAVGVTDMETVKRAASGAAKYTHILYSCCVTSQRSIVHFLYSTEVTNQKPRNLLQHCYTHTQRQTQAATGQNRLYCEVALAKNSTHSLLSPVVHFVIFFVHDCCAQYEANMSAFSYNIFCLLNSSYIKRHSKPVSQILLC